MSVEPFNTGNVEAGKDLPLERLSTDDLPEWDLASGPPGQLLPYPPFLRDEEGRVSACPGHVRLAEMVPLPPTDEEAAEAAGFVDKCDLDLAPLGHGNAEFERLRRDAEAAEAEAAGRKPDLPRIRPDPAVHESTLARLVRADEQMLEKYCAIDESGDFAHALVSIAVRFCKLPHVVHQSVQQLALFKGLPVPDRSAELDLTALILYVLTNPDGGNDVLDEHGRAAAPAVPPAALDATSTGTTMVDEEPKRGPAGPFRPAFTVPTHSEGNMANMLDVDCDPRQDDPRLMPSFLFGQSLGPLLSGLSVAHYNNLMLAFHNQFGFNSRKTGNRLTRFRQMGERLFEYEPVLPGTEAYDERIQAATENDPHSLYQTNSNETYSLGLRDVITKLGSTEGVDRTLVGIWYTTSCFSIVKYLPSDWAGGVGRVTNKILSIISANSNDFDLVRDQSGKWCPQYGHFAFQPFYPSPPLPFALPMGKPMFPVPHQVYPAPYGCAPAPPAPKLKIKGRNAKETRRLWYEEKMGHLPKAHSKAPKAKVRTAPPPKAYQPPPPVFDQSEFPSLGAGIKA